MAVFEGVDALLPKETAWFGLEVAGDVGEYTLLVYLLSDFEKVFECFFCIEFAHNPRDVAWFRAECSQLAAKENIIPLGCLDGVAISLVVDSYDIGTAREGDFDSIVSSADGIKRTEASFYDLDFCFRLREPVRVVAS